jgi:hypothetical protein
MTIQEVSDRDIAFRFGLSRGRPWQIRKQAVGWVIRMYHAHRFGQRLSRQARADVHEFWPEIRGTDG